MFYDCVPKFNTNTFLWRELVLNGTSGLIRGKWFLYYSEVGALKRLSPSSNLIENTGKILNDTLGTSP